MKTTLISKEDNRAKFTMDFTAEEFESAVIKVYQKNKGQFAVDGFRKGKAPRSIIERRYGEGVFFDDAINDMLQNNYNAALTELDLETIDYPSVDPGEVGKGKPVTFTVEVPLFPIIPVKDYFGVAVDEYDFEVTPEDIDREIEAKRKSVARLVEVKRPVEKGDTVTLDFAGSVDGVPFEGGTAEDYDLVIGSGQFIPGFEDQLIGAEAGSEVDVNVTFPEQYQEKSLAGKDAVFHCTIKEVKAEELVDIDDEFAKDVSEFDTLEELRADIEKNLREGLDRQAADMAKDLILQKICDANEYEAPASMVESEIDTMVRELQQNLMYSGLSVDQYLQYTGKTNEEFRNDMRSDAAKRAATRVIIRSIGEAENVEVTDEDIDKEFERMAKQYRSDVETVKESMSDIIPALRKELAIPKVIDMLYDKAVVTKVKPPVAEEAKEAEEETEAPADAE